MKIKTTAEVLIAKQFDLGESPIYNNKTNKLSWVDITQSTLYETDFIPDGSSPLQQFGLGQYIGAAVPTRENRYITALTTGIYLFSPTDGLKRLAQPYSVHENHRFNDGKCDPKGRFLAGTMSLLEADQQEHSLYIYEQNTPLHTLLSNVKLSNGLAWSADQKTVYYIDTLTYQVSVYEYDIEEGSFGKPIKHIPVKGGSPDGMTIDREGMLWVALYGGGAVIRINPESGQEVSRISVPAKNITSCCFAGDNLEYLVITSAREPDPDDKIGGKVFIANPGVSGMPDNLFDDTNLSFTT